MNTDESRFISLTHRKGRKERKAEEQKSLRSLQLIEFHGIPTAQGNNEMVIFQTGLTGSTGCVISYNPVHPVIPSRKKKPQMNADECRLIALFHRKKHKAQMHKSLYLEEIIRPGTRVTRIKRIYTDLCASASSVASVFYHINTINVYNEPQMNADERRFVILGSIVEDKPK